ncbi:MAG: aminodeoxychorismate lyase [Gammaproteobacteria bacterium]|nr:aminodeoxychorismate lyase [Gammaproteobacteria bacterium]MBU1554951.1 aminodeoxychorismate lyase [Gammaproteobacteria bacterium]MBU2071001.1 aminodeoxychorismate lyase [Gammaproteobacteria bacterium]MBU2183827.1 aminodeoxychorismate lyase [Gammaproteobacteria bacterium]MBU2206474.1 aminodeoxychorismate lyase [Gammaproteobacteria bacterium]
MIIVNGQQNTEISVKDRGLCYGDGLFETVKVKHSQPKLWRLHLDRLVKGCQALRIPLPDLAALQRDVDSVISATGSNMVLKIIVTRGVGQRGYAFSGDEKPSVIVMSAPEYTQDANAYITGVRAITCKTRLSDNVNLAGIKHLNRLEQVMARAEWHDPAIKEGLMLDAQGFVIEGTMSNILLEKDGVIYTPQLNRAGVCGVLRRKVLAILQAENRPAVVKDITLQELLAADSVAICNALLGVMPLSQLDNSIFTIGAVMQDIVSRNLQDSDV